MEENNFPVKYTIIGITEENRLVAYIATKCFVTGIVTRFNKDGDASTCYEVVLPFKTLNSEKITPEFGLEGICSNFEIVDQLFDSYGETLTVADEANKNMEVERIANISSKENMETIYTRVHREVSRNIERVLEFQDYIEAHTQDLVIYKEKIDHSISLRRIFKEGE